MRRGLLPFSPVAKQTSFDLDDVSLAQMFLDRKPERPGPEWYARLLDEHSHEIALVIAAWFLVVRDRLALRDLADWGDSVLWFDLEQSLARSLAPVLRATARESARRQAVEANEPVPLRMVDFEIAAWSGTEAARQAQFIAFESRSALGVALKEAEEAGLSDDMTRRLVIDTGLFALHRRFAESVLNRSLVDDEPFDSMLNTVREHSERLMAVRGEAITQGNAVDAIHVGMATTAYYWSREGKTVTKTWVSQVDELRCPICASLHMQTVRRDQRFEAYDGSMYEHPKAHLNCRCFVVYGVRAEEEDWLGFL